MDWLSLSPDLNPKEHAWDKLQQAISARQELPKNREELSAALVEEWARLPQIFFRWLIRSMQRRCRAFCQARGGHTRCWTHQVTVQLVTLEFSIHHQGLFWGLCNNYSWFTLTLDWGLINPIKIVCLLVKDLYYIVMMIYIVICCKISNL
jgi:hypothetical protein